MKFDNSFDVSLPPAEAWIVLMDVERIAPCMPGATLTEIIDDKNFKGTVSVRLGPVALTFEGLAAFENVDEVAQTAEVKAQGKDPKGRGGANAAVTFSIEPIDTGSRVLIETDLTLSGSVAQYGRGVGMVKDLSQQIIGQFAENLKNNVIDAETEAEKEIDLVQEDRKTIPAKETPQPAAAPIQVGSMGLIVIWNAIKRLFGAK